MKPPQTGSYTLYGFAFTAEQASSFINAVSNREVDYKIDGTKISTSFKIVNDSSTVN
ncbi:hypothetical protein FACS1894166_05090 [Bacilli bacterium]|nr:hypothetical protein FACS1894166_05090 [Bacilli bacterium]